MFAVKGIGSYISRGVYTVSGPFHPFGGAVDIIVVEQPDGSFKSSPWYVRFGKFQGVLKASERVVRINVNGDDSNLHMYLDNKGEAIFLREVDEMGGESEVDPSSGDEIDSMYDPWKTRKSKSYNFDANRTDLVSKLEASDKKILPRTNSPRGRIFGLSFGRRSMKDNSYREGEGGVGMDRASSLERAEIAADLLEVRWTTNLATATNGNVDSPKRCSPQLPAGGVVSEVRVEERASPKDSSWSGHDENKVSSSMSHQDNFASAAVDSYQSVCSTTEIDEKVPCCMNPGNYMEIVSVQETYMGVTLPPDRSDVSTAGDNGVIDSDRIVQSHISEDSESILEVSHTLITENNKGCVSSFEEHSSIRNVSPDGTITEILSRVDKVEPSTCLDAKVGLSSYNGQSDGSLPSAGEAHKCPEPDLSFPGSEINKEGDSLENASCNGDEKPLCDIAEAQLVNNLSTPVSNTDEGLAGGFVSKNQVIEETRPSLCLVSEECSGDSTCEGNSNATPSENSEEEQFFFSDLDEPKVEIVEGNEVLSPEDKIKGLSKNFRGTSEEEFPEAIIRDNEPHQLTVEPLDDELLINHLASRVKTNSVSSPIAISNVPKQADLEFLAPVVESLPNMPFSGDNINPYGVPDPLSRSLDSNLEALKIVNNDVLVSSGSGTEQHHVQLHNNSSHISEEIKKIVADPAVEVSLCRHLLYEGMGYEAAGLAFDAEKLDVDKFSSLYPDILNDDKLAVRIGGLYFPWDAALPIASAIGSEGREQVLEPKGMIAVGQVNKTSEERPQKSKNSRNGSWKIWPFSFKRSDGDNNDINSSSSSNSNNNSSNNANSGILSLKRSDSMKHKNMESQTTSESPLENEGNKDVGETKVTKKKIRDKVPTSEQLASLNLKEGKNVVTFTFSTAMLGNQQVDARIFLWNWKSRIVISDVDGTITKSDVLGQFMPLMGLDWSQTGVTHLFSAIKENGYHLLFLSARSILQAYHTRQFLVNLKQDGKALPEGPVVISPDGLFPSLYREVIRRAPHEFKISCLEDIKALFPQDHNPFYAGFGNRDTDELSYLKVGIPRGKIFTINPKGQIVVNHRVDTKSYTSLHSLVHDMFPPTTVTEQEDYNSWNFWRLPPPDVVF